MATKIHLLNTRLSFANGLFTASSMEEGQQKKYGADFIITPDSKVLLVSADGTKKPTTMAAAMLLEANLGWKGKGAPVLAALEASKKCYRDGSLKLTGTGEARDGYDGNWYVTAKNATRPGTFDAARRPVTQEDGVLYSGCYVNAIVELYSNTQPTKKGVFASLLGVQFVGDGDSFGGGRAAGADEFDDVTEGAGAEDFA